ncbi:MAG TPA: periplasmic heavy metal sensor [Burkholderiales bacterium]|jgi:Spy/CpxP family protein refolding chaperone
MSEHRRNTPSESNLDAGTPNQRGNRRRFFAGLLTGGVIGGLLAGAVSAWSHGEAPGGWHGRGWCRTHAMNPVDERARLEFAADWVLNRIQASEAQREQVKDVLGQALQDLGPLRDRHRRHRDDFAAALAQPAVDRAALEELRRAELALAEQASTRIVTALADIADALTPEQRAELLKLAEQLRH